MHRLPKNLLLPLLLLIPLLFAFIAQTTEAQKGIVFEVTTDKSQYAVGEDVSITIKAINTSSISQTLSFSSSQQADYVIDGKYRQSADKFFAQFLTSVEIPGGSSYQWKFIHKSADYKLEAGSHTILGEVVGYGNASVQVTVGAATPLVKYFQYVMSDDPREGFIVKMTNPATIQQAIDDLNGQRRLIVSGIVNSGNGGFNSPWNWHLDSATIILNENFIELCDARPSYVETHLAEWLGQRYCPWVARVNAVYDIPPTSTTLVTTQKQDLSFEVLTDKTIYSPNENIIIVIKVKNNSSQSTILNFSSSYQSDYVIDGKFRWSSDKAFTQALTFVTLEPFGAKEWRFTHTPVQYGLSVGSHTILGEVVGYGRASTQIEIIAPSCGNCTCEANETAASCRKDCDFSFISFSATTTENRAREIITSCGGLVDGWFDVINAAGTKTNRCTSMQFKSCVEAYRNEVRQVQLSKYFVGDMPFVVLQYGLGDKYTNPGKCNIKGWHTGAVYKSEQNACVQSGQVRLPPRTVGFWWEYTMGTAFFYIAKQATVDQNTVNTGDGLELVTQIKLLPSDSLPMTAAISDVFLEPRLLTDEEVQEEIDYVVSRAFPECNTSSSLTEANVRGNKKGDNKTCGDGLKFYCATENECFCIPVISSIPRPSALVTIQVRASALNVRQDAALTAQKIGLVRQGEVLKKFEEKNGWVKVELSSGQTGWVFGQHVAPAAVPTVSVSRQKVIVTAWVLNVRSGAGINTKVITTVQQNAVLEKLEEKSGWIKVILVNGQSGWVYGKFVK